MLLLLPRNIQKVTKNLLASTKKSLVGSMKNQNVFKEITLAFLWEACWLFISLQCEEYTKAHQTLSLSLSRSA